MGTRDLLDPDDLVFIPESPSSSLTLAGCVGRTGLGSMPLDHHVLSNGHSAQNSLAWMAGPGADNFIFHVFALGERECGRLTGSVCEFPPLSRMPAASPEIREWTVSSLRCSNTFSQERCVD